MFSDSNTRIGKLKERFFYDLIYTISLKDKKFSQSH